MSGKALPQRKGDGGGAGVHVQLDQDMLDVVLDRALAERQIPGDVTVGPTFGEQLQNLYFSRREIEVRAGNWRRGGSPAST